MHQTNNTKTAGVIFTLGLAISLIILAINKGYFDTLKSIFLSNVATTRTEGNPLGWILLLVCLFFVIRELSTWYWKINKMISLLEQIEENTRKDTKSDIK